jgi:hypothetical protein
VDTNLLSENMKAGELFGALYSGGNTMLAADLEGTEGKNMHWLLAEVRNLLRAVVNAVKDMRAEYKAIEFLDQPRAFSF